MKLIHPFSRLMHMPAHVTAGLALLAATAIAGTVSSCATEDRPQTGNVGYIRPTVSVNGADAPDATAFALSITTPDGASSTWGSVAEYPAEQGLLAGAYLLEASSGHPEMEGYGVPYYYGSATVAVLPDRVTEAAIECTRRNVALTVNRDESFTDDVAESSVIIHAYGGEYVNVDYNRADPLYVRHGETDILLHFKLRDGREATVLAARFTTAEGADIPITLATTDASEKAATITVTVGSELYSVQLTDELFDTPLPEIIAEGFTPGEAVDILEGIASGERVVMTVEAGVPLREAVLTVQAPSLMAMGLRPEVDLLADNGTSLHTLANAGITVIPSEDGRRLLVDFTGALPLLHIPGDAMPPRFSLIALDALGQLSLPCTLSVNVLPSGVAVKALNPVVYGSHEATAILTAPSPDFASNLTIAVRDGATATQPVTVKGVVPGEQAGEYAVTFGLPEYAASNVEVEFSYMGVAFDSRTLTFTSPAYTIEVDAFAHHALVRVSAATEELRRLITNTVNIYVDGAWAHVYSRDANLGILWVTGLSEDTDYTFAATIFGNPGASDFTPVVKAHTEKTAGLPNSDFEETVEEIKYEGLARGGYYSQSALAVYNRLNRADYRVNVPKSPWATVNAKTFCRNASNLNTWYMQPSTMESSNIINGTVSVRLVSVAFDPAGEPIPPYRQLSEPYISYNPNVPAIGRRAAGKIFLGSYSYSPEAGETYSEGIPFGSRPSAINGIYRYLPGLSSPEDCGRVDVTLYGRVDGVLVAIASAVGRLYPSTTNATFSVPITYGIFGVKAEAITVMLSSSYDIGTIDYESTHIHTTPDPLSASSTGSVLEVDNITLSY